MSKTWNQCFKLESLLNRLSKFLKFKGNSVPKSPKHYHITLVQNSFHSKWSQVASYNTQWIMIWGCGLFCSNNNKTYLPWNIPVFQKMIFYFQRRVSASYKSCNAELGRYYLQARLEAGMGVFVLVWQSVLLRNCKTVDTLLLEEETHWQSCRCFSRLWAIQVQKLCGAF